MDWARSSLRRALWFAVLLLSSATVPARTVIFVSVPPEAGWQDAAFLAAVPAADKANGGQPAVIALSDPASIPPETHDYLRRYEPEQVYALGCRTQPLKTARTLDAGSATAAARVLSRTFWKSATNLVLCAENDYSAALTASALAGRLGVPLLFCTDKGLPDDVAAEIERLGAAEVIVIGNGPNSIPALEKRELRIRRLADAKAVLDWMSAIEVPVSYLAVVNANDRTHTVKKKLSLAAPLLAVARQGMVLPLSYAAQWKRGFRCTPTAKGGKNGNNAETALPRGIPKSEAPPRAGRITLGGGYDFVVTGKPKNRRLRVNIDLNGNGNFGDVGEGPFAIADTVNIEDKTYSISLGPKNGAGKCDLWLTWPMAEDIHDELRTYYGRTGNHPQYLCLVGHLDAIPAFIVAKGDVDLQSDYPYSDVDDDMFAEICVSRVVADDASAATLYASRVVTYPNLLDDSWRYSIGEAMWENTYWPLFENAGFRKRVRHDKEDLKWIKKPDENGKGGKRTNRFEPDSGLTSVGAMAHMAHSMWTNLGQTYWWDSKPLLAPTLVESGGCRTAALDKETDCKSVVSQLLRNGAVAFHGNSRPGIAYQEHLRMEFWNRVLEGKTTGQAHRAAQNSILLAMMDHNQRTSGPNHHSLFIRTLFGDPAFKMSVPSALKSAPARVTVKNDLVTVHGPERWWPVKMRVPEDWKKWYGKDLYVCRGAGAYAARRWCGEQYDLEEMYINAEIRTSRKIKAITQLQSVPEPLGWNGKFWCDEHHDGTRTYRWRVRLLDFDQPTGKIVNKIDKVEYGIDWSQ